jgi:hypothetical protein
MTDVRLMQTTDGGHLGKRCDLVSAAMIGTGIAGTFPLSGSRLPESLIASR